MKVLVTGGAGFIGSAFLNMLVPRHPEHSFLCVDKLTYAGNPMSLDGLKTRGNFSLEIADIADGPSVDRIFDAHRPEVVVHFAAETHVDRSIHDPGEFVRTNVVGTLALLNASRALHKAGRSPEFRRFHHVSTDEVYGSLADEGAFTEDTRYDPSSPYAASKASSDHLVRAFHRTYGLPTTITNCSNNYGPRQAPEKLIPLTLLNALAGRELPVYGQGRNKRDWLYVEDHCDAVWTVIERGAVGETYNVGGGEERSNIDVVRAICELVAEESGAPRERLLALIRFVEDRPGHDWRYAIDASKIHRELGWAPRMRLATGLRSTLRWYMAHPEWVAAVQSGAHQAWLTTNYEHRLKSGRAADGTRKSSEGKDS
ncbi:MAG: dTDP-glucose 4,6-dehydratase [Polyangiaceae bacterium]